MKHDHIVPAQAQELVRPPVAAGTGAHGNGPAAAREAALAPPKETRPDIGVAGDPRHGVTRILNVLLADEYVLHTKSRNFHWNVSGPEFLQLHAFFQGQYEQLSEAVDEIAERVRILGGRPLATLAEFTEHARLAEQPGDPQSARTMLTQLLGDHESIARQIRKDIEKCTHDHKEAGTADLLTSLLEKHEKTAWILRSLLTEGR